MSSKEKVDAFLPAHAISRQATRNSPDLADRRIIAPQKRSFLGNPGVGV